MTDQASEQKPFDAQAVVFTALANWIAERDGITPDQAAINLANLLGSPEVVAETQAAEAAKAETEEKAAKADVATEAVTQIQGILDNLRTQLGL